jgi:serine/threonine protein kinase
VSTPTTLVADRYRLVKLLGRGGMGVVWQAWDERLHRPVALKLLRTQVLATDDEREVAKNRAMREARLTARLHHPHAVTVFDVVEHEGEPCLVMELIECTPLSDLVRAHGPLSPRQAARMGAEVASALAAAHKLRIVHRDVKPGNVLITDDGSAMISDFGISHALGDDTITATGMMHGTPAYLAPEVARGQPSSFASDVFSLGSTLYAAVEGVPPFGADHNSIALLHRVATGAFPPPTRAGALAPLILDMLATAPKQRPPMKAIAARLTALHESSDSAGAPELPTVPLGEASSTVVLGQPPETTALDAEREPARDEETAETHRIGTTAETDRFVPIADTPVEPIANTRRLEPAAATPTAPIAPPPSVPPSTEPTRDPQRRRRSSPTMLVGLLIAAAILALAAALAPGWLDQQGGTANEPNTARTPTAATTTPEAAAPPVTQTPAPGPAPPPAEDPATRQQQLADAIVSYYALIPYDLDEAWPRMTADYQENHAGGREYFEYFWSDVSQVEISDVVASAPDYVQATLTYYFTDGRVVQEVTAYWLVDENGMLKIAASEVLSSVTL